MDALPFAPRRPRWAIASLVLAALMLATTAIPASAQPATPYSLNGSWDGDQADPVRRVTITQTSSQVTARYREPRDCGASPSGAHIVYQIGEVAFSGTLTSGGILNGNHSLCMYEDETFTVPIAKDTGPLVMTVSDDGLHLTGTWFDDVHLVDVPISYTKEPSVSVGSFVFADDNDTDHLLKYLSVSSHTYFNGVTRLYGRLTIKRTAGASSSVQLTSIKLEASQSGVVRATGLLNKALLDTYINRPFSSAGVLGSNTAPPAMLFELPSSQTAQLSPGFSVQLRLKIQLSNGEEFLQPYGASLTPLVQYAGTNRYGTRDPDRGGDDWVLPKVKNILDHYRTTYGTSLGLLYGDMSNMNAGVFPGHQGHDDGAEVDAWFNGYNARTPVVAQRLITLLNDTTYGPRIQKVFVTYREGTACDAFCNAIRNVVLRDGRRARDVIRPVPGHDTHFHWNIRP